MGLRAEREICVELEKVIEKQKAERKIRKKELDEKTKELDDANKKWANEIEDEKTKNQDLKKQLETKTEENLKMNKIQKEKSDKKIEEMKVELDIKRQEIKKYKIDLEDIKNENQILNEKNEELKFLSTETELNKKNEEIIIQLEHQISDLKDQNALQAKEIENQEFELDHANEQNERQEDRIQKHITN